LAKILSSTQSQQDVIEYYSYARSINTALTFGYGNSNKPCGGSTSASASYEPSSPLPSPSQLSLSAAAASVELDKWLQAFSNGKNSIDSIFGKAAGRNDAASNELTSVIAIWSLSKDGTARLLEAYRANRITITNALLTALTPVSTKYAQRQRCPVALPLPAEHQPLRTRP